MLIFAYFIKNSCDTAVYLSSTLITIIIVPNKKKRQKPKIAFISKFVYQVFLVQKKKQSEKLTFNAAQKKSHQIKVQTPEMTENF